MLLELARKTRHRHNKSRIILMPVVMVSIVLRALFPCLKQVFSLNLDKMFLIFVFNLLDTPVFLES